MIEIICSGIGGQGVLVAGRKERFLVSFLWI